MLEVLRTKLGIARATAVVLTVIALAPAIAAIAELGFSRSVTAVLVDRYATLFGNSARRHLNNWQKFIQTLNPGGEPADRAMDASRVLGRVNAFVNRVPWISDFEHWHVIDYWATPAEMFASDGGDCEDFVIAKYFALKELGMPIERLRFVYVRTRQSSEPHMVLAYYAKPEAIPLILDNLFGWIVPATERPDLTPVYSFNDDDLVLADGRFASQGNLTSQGKLNPMLIRQWKNLIEKLQMELRYSRARHGG
jgi:predicted transglutaminase-like cysteine proteinase